MSADYAQLAASLRDNEAFQLALDNMRNGALEAMVLTNPTSVDKIIEHQTTVKVVDDLRGNLEQFIRSGLLKKPPGIA